MSIFANIVYPDNEKRAARVMQLINDIRHQYQTLIAQKAQFEAAANEFTQCYTHLVPDLKCVKLGLDTLSKNESWTVEIPFMIKKLLLKKAVEKALEFSSASAAAATSAQAATLLGRLASLPRWLAANQLSRVVIVAFVADLIMSLIKGGEESDRLKAAIKEQMKPREKLTLAVRQMECLINFVQGVTVGLQLNSRTAAQVMNEEQKKSFYEKFINNSSVEFAAASDAITPKRIKSELSTLDSQRGSYTDDDK